MSTDAPKQDHGEIEEGADGSRYMMLGGDDGGTAEKVRIPHGAATLEFVLVPPVDLHLFEEPPIVKEIDGDDGSHH